jgi:hypothetical protein
MSERGKEEENKKTSLPAATIGSQQGYETKQSNKICHFLGSQGTNPRTTKHLKRRLLLSPRNTRNLLLRLCNLR